MKIRLNREDRVELLKAIQAGELDTLKVPSLFQCLEGGNAFLELMKSLPDEDTPSPRKAILAQQGDRGSLDLSEI